MGEHTTVTRRITCGKYDRYISLDDRPVRVRRLWSQKPSQLKQVDWTPLATDGEYVRCGKFKSTIGTFFDSIDSTSRRHLIVLTDKEANFLRSAAINSGVRVSVFERDFPIFDEIRYRTNIDANFNTLTMLLAKVKKWGFRNKSLGKYVSNEFLYRVERKLRQKNSNDYYPALAYRPGYQEVFKLREDRNDRRIIALDFNSMFASCMEGGFAEPKSLRRLCRDQLDLLDVGSLPKGIYKALLKNPSTEFIRKYHPFKFVQLNRAYNFELENGDGVEVLLFDNEINYYARHFGSVELTAGFVSDRVISHPLCKIAKRLYKERKAYKRDGNVAMDNLCKFKLQCMHSSTNRKQIKSKLLPSATALENYLREEFSILIPPNITINQAIHHIQSGGSIELKKIGDGFEVRSNRLDSDGVLYGLSSQILANSRLKMLETIEHFLSYEGVEICYANTDSIHVSIPRDGLSKFLTKIGHQISDDIGQLKIQAVAESGFWFDVGRYWLADRNDLVYFKNAGFNGKGSANSFTRVRKRTEVIDGEFFCDVRHYYVNIHESFSFNKRIDRVAENNIHYRRFSFSDIDGIDQAVSTCVRETLKSMPVKLDLFNDIGSRIS